MSSRCAEPDAVLHVVGSPKGADSTSSRVARAFLDEYRQTHPDHTVTTLDVWSDDLPPVDGDVIMAKIAPLLGEPTTPAQDEAWAGVVAVIDEFRRHDKIVISTPMWNFGIPYALKHYIDLLVQPGITFGLDEAFEHIGLLEDRPVQLVLTRSSTIADGSPDDFQLPYLRHVLGFIGLSDIRAMVVEGTTLPRDARETFVAESCERARILATDF
jgi:FMN-dependent NADH-azoreductase